MPDNALAGLKRATSIGPGPKYPEEIPESEFLGRVRNPGQLIQEIAGSPLGQMMMLGIPMGKMGGMARPEPKLLPSPAVQELQRIAPRPSPQATLGEVSSEFTPVGSEWLYNQGRPGMNMLPDAVEKVFEHVLRKGGR